jgi:hypothetical protein
MVSKINDSAHFMRRIIELVRDHKMEYLDAIMTYVDETGIEVEYAAALVKRCGPIQQMLEAELIENRMLPAPQAVSLTTFMVDDN